ncbi:MAG: efflux RND transporter periplasmic adaptor subunit [Lentisphaeria bacterium]|nr:efflux RND transporter periplasmic adaptor subunit [Lentisphaeria bacterium]
MSKLFSPNSGSTKVKAPNRKAIFAIPIFLLVGVLSVFAYSGKDMFKQKITVQSTRAQLQEGGGAVVEGKALFQAAGWIHADPYPVQATAFISGIISKIHVIGGQTVKKGQLLAELDPVDAEIALNLAKEHLHHYKMDKELHQSELKILEAQINEVMTLENTAKAHLKTAIAKANRLNQSGSAISIFEREQATLEAAASQEKVKEYQASVEVLKAKLLKQQKQIDVADAFVRTQAIAVAKKQLDLERCKVYSPINGIVQTMHAREGRKQMLGADNPYSTTVAEIFDPKQVQVKVDVPLNEVGKVVPGQKTRIHLEAIDKVLDGEVFALEGKADYQKNTLEALVKIPGGHASLRPDMLAQVEFLSQGQKVTSTSKSSRTYIDPSTIVNGNQVFVINENDEAELVTVELGDKELDGWKEVIAGVNPGQRIITNPPAGLEYGTPVEVGGQ